ncbi:MAG: helix-turn-helix domain-containing protein [Candidatus Paceibacterota bacterium]
MNQKILEELGFTKNEARIYLVLLEYNELGVSDIAINAEINRRNVYDTLNRLVEKGYVFEVRRHRESVYRAVDPKKLSEEVREKQERLDASMPQFLKLYKKEERDEEVFIYRGLEGWKNYMRDILEIGEDVYTIGGRGAWSDERMRDFLEYFAKESQKKNIWFNILFDPEVQSAKPSLLEFEEINLNHKYLPEGFGTSAAVDIFGDRVVVTTNTGVGEILEDDVSFTVIVNQQTADAFRVWFDLLWDASTFLRRRKKKSGKTKKSS